MSEVPMYQALVFKAHRWLYHSTLGSRVIKKRTKYQSLAAQVSFALVEIVYVKAMR